MQFATCLHCSVPRVRCRKHGAKTVKVPWAARNSRFTKLPQADIVHARFHISQHLNEAVDKVRRQENKALKEAGDRRLAGARFNWPSPGEGHVSRLGFLTSLRQLFFHPLSSLPSLLPQRFDLGLRQPSVLL